MGADPLEHLLRSGWVDQRVAPRGDLADGRGGRCPDLLEAARRPGHDRREQRPRRRRRTSGSGHGSRDRRRGRCGTPDARAVGAGGRRGRRRRAGRRDPARRPVAVLDSPTTSMSRTPQQRLEACRTTSWSSRRYTRIGVLLSAMGQFLPASGAQARTDSVHRWGRTVSRPLEGPSRRVLYAPARESARLYRPWHASQRVLAEPGPASRRNLPATRVAVVDNAGKTRRLARSCRARRRLALPQRARRAESGSPAVSGPGRAPGPRGPGPPRDHDSGPLPRRRAPQIPPRQRLGGRTVEVGGRLVQPQHRLVGEQGAGDRDPGALAARDLCVPVAQPAVEAVGQRVQPAAEAGWRKSAPSTSSSVADGRASRTFSASVLAKTWGRRRRGRRCRGRRPGRARAMPVASPGARRRAPWKSTKRISSAAACSCPTRSGRRPQPARPGQVQVESSGRPSRPQAAATPSTDTTSPSRRDGSAGRRPRAGARSGAASRSSAARVRADSALASASCPATSPSAKGAATSSAIIGRRAHRRPRPSSAAGPHRRPRARSRAAPGLARVASHVADATVRRPSSTLSAPTASRARSSACHRELARGLVASTTASESRAGRDRALLGPGRPSTREQVAHPAAAQTAATGGGSASGEHSHRGRDARQ